ncbi:MAG: hypothetical protein V9E82_01305 [Candidatus Nanopelagicales bacterium]
MNRNPGWYGAVMGTGATALAISVQAATWQTSWLRWMAHIFLVLASVLAVVLLPRYLGRLRDRAALVREIGDSAHGAMLATLPAGLLVLAAAWGRVGWAPIGVWVDIVLVSVGALLALWLGLMWSAGLLRGANELVAVNGGWLIPPVMNLLVPLALAPIIVRFPQAAQLLTVVGFAFYGIGAVLFLAMLTLLIARLALRPPLPAQQAPSMWIPLAPAGVLGMSLLQLLRAAQEAGVPGASITAGLIVSSMGLGFGLWWAGFAWIELRRALPSANPGWWGFVFPVAAMTLSLANLGLYTQVGVLEVLGALATTVLLGLWGFVAARTAGMLRG